VVVANRKGVTSTIGINILCEDTDFYNNLIGQSKGYDSKKQIKEGNFGFHT